MISILIILLLTFASCKGSIDNMTITSANKSNITLSNVLTTMTQDVKHYNIEPVYYAYVDHEQCFFELFVNDIPVFRYFEDGGIMSTFNLNEYLTKSGKQKLTYKLYPQTTRTHGPGFNTLTNYTKFDVRIYWGDNADKNTFDTEKLVLESKNIVNERTKFFIGAGLPYYEYTIEFEAEVPFEPIDLTKVKDLRLMDQKELKTKTIQAYDYLKSVIENGETDKYLNLRYNSMVYPLIALHQPEEIIKEDLVEYLKYFDKEKDIKLESISEYPNKIVLYANGRLVSLEHDNKDDPRLRFESMLWGKYKYKGRNRASFMKLYLYIPEGKDTFEIW